MILPIVLTILAVLVVWAFVRRELKRAKKRRSDAVRHESRERRRAEMARLEHEQKNRVHGAIANAARREQVEAAQSSAACDPLFETAARFAVEQGYISTGLLMQTYAIPLEQAILLIAAFERAGIVGLVETQGLRAVRVKSQRILDEIILDLLVGS